MAAASQPHLLTPQLRICRMNQKYSNQTFNAASLRARAGKSLGDFRWIIWDVYPVTRGRENTAFQELAVEVSE